MAESPYSGSGIPSVTNSFIPDVRISGSAQVIANFLAFKLLKHGTLRDIEPTARVFWYCLPDFWWNIAFFVTQMAFEVRVEGVLAPEPPSSSAAEFQQ